MGPFLWHFTCGFLIQFIASTSASTSEASSFVVSANYGVQSEESSNDKRPQSLQIAQERKSESKQLVHELLPTASAWKGCHQQHFQPTPHERHSQKNPSIYVNNAATPNPLMQTSRGLSQFGSSTLTERPYTIDDIIYGSSNTPTSLSRHYPSIKSNKRVDGTPPGYEGNEIFNDPNKPSVKDLQQLISKLIQGPTKVHQVVKVPAMYEIHLQEQEAPKSVPWADPGTPSWSWKQLPTGSWRKMPGTATYPRGSRHVTKTWNLPSKIKYFEKFPETAYGKYAHPRPFWKAPTSRDAMFPQHDSSLQASQHSYGTVSVPITPGSTAVSFLDYKVPIKYQGQAGVPDLSLYYSKKKEIEQHRPSDIQRRRSEDWRQNNWRRDGRRVHSPLEGLNYIIHIREKVAPGRFR